METAQSSRHGGKHSSTVTALQLGEDLQPCGTRKTTMQSTARTQRVINRSQCRRGGNEGGERQSHVGQLTEHTGPRSTSGRNKLPLSGLWEGTPGQSHKEKTLPGEGWRRTRKLFFPADAPYRAAAAALMRGGSAHGQHSGLQGVWGQPGTGSSSFLLQLHPHQELLKPLCHRRQPWYF